MQLTARAKTTQRATAAELERALGYFPLSPALHQALGIKLAGTRGSDPVKWQQHFRIAARLVPGSWSLLADQARASFRASPGFAVHSWQRAIERGGHRREEILRLAIEATAQMPTTAQIWSSYVDAQPDLLLTHAQMLAGEAGREEFARWWERRFLAGAALTKSEIDDFPRVAAKWGTPAQLQLWMERHAHLQARDGRRWAEVLHTWGENERAWQLLRERIPNPEFPDSPPAISREILELRWREKPEDLVNARALAHLLSRTQEAESSDAVIIASARRPDAPAWFLHKAAHLLAEDGKFADAVAIALREPR
jgi:hypothetical protein